MVAVRCSVQPQTVGVTWRLGSTDIQLFTVTLLNSWSRPTQHRWLVLISSSTEPSLEATGRREVTSMAEELREGREGGKRGRIRGREGCESEYMYM